MNKINIFITAIGHPSFRGGGNTAAHNFAESFAKLGYKVTAIFSSPPAFLKTRPPTSYRLIILRDSRFPFINCFRINEALKKILPTSEKSVVINFGYEALFVSKKRAFFIAASLSPTLKYVKFKDLFSDPRYFLPSNLGKWLILYSSYFDRLVKIKADLVQCLCRAAAEECRTVYKISNNKIFTIGLGIDTKKFSFKTRTKKEDILFVGGTAEYKGLDILIKAMPEVLRKHPQTRLKVVGELNSKREKELEQLAVALRISSNVDWFGLVPQEKMPDFYSKAYALIFPSRAESFLLAAIEAMVCGIPIIATPVGIISEIIIDGLNGFIIKSEDSESLSAAIIKLLDDPQEAEKIGKAGRKTVEEKFAWENLSKQYAIEIEKLVFK